MVVVRVLSASATPSKSLVFHPHSKEKEQPEASTQLQIKQREHMYGVWDLVST
jgi:hypothetical protein